MSRRRPGPGALLALVAALALGGCAPAPPADGPPVVAVTLFPVADLTQRVAGGAARVETLLPPRASPSTWEITPGQLRAVAGARALVTVGAGLDAWAGRLLPDERGLRELRLTEGMTLMEADHGHGHDEHDGHDHGGDPHIWLDPLLVRDRVLPRLEALLVEVAPDSAAAIRTRSGRLADSLTALDEEIRRILAGRDGDRFVATHGAWSYFARAYGLEPLGSLYERPGHQPSARGLASLVRQARAARLSSVLTEPQLASSAAEALAGELGVGIRVVDPLGGPGLEGREGYLPMMRFNARSFRDALTTS